MPAFSHFPKKKQRPDHVILAVVALLLGFASLVLYSATYKVKALGDIDPYWVRQSVWMVVGLIVMWVVAHSDYKKIGMMSWPLYAIGLVLLVSVFIFGRKISGAQRWLDIGPLALQPSEFMKIIYILAMAWYCDTVGAKRMNFVSICGAALITAIPFLLIAKEPDLGTSLVLMPIFMAVLFIAGVSWLYFAGFALIGLASAPLAWFFVLKAYQKQRIMMFLDPHYDQFGGGWATIQSRIAIGSGKFWGKGMMKGSQTQLDFLPEHHTDFIFAVVGEEWGFIGALVLLLLFLTLLCRALWIAQRTDDPFGRYVVVGVVALWGFQTLINVGMTFGAFPVTGIPLPFFSYGGSALVSNLVGVGLILSVKRFGRRI